MCDRDQQGRKEGRRGGREVRGGARSIEVSYMGQYERAENNGRGRGAGPFQTAPAGLY
jgi:hypothetical protein